MAKLVLEFPIGALTEKECLEYSSSPSAGRPSLDISVRLCHLDLGPGNIVISDRVMAGDIEMGGRWPYPVFWNATQPSVAHGLEFGPYSIPIAGCKAFG